MQIFETLQARFVQRKRNAHDTLVSAARRLAADETVDAAGVEAALAETGTTVDEFREMVDLQRRRNGWAADLAKRPAAQARHDKALAALEVERAAFAKLQAAHNDKVGRLSGELREAEAVVRAGDEATGKLRDPEHLAGTLADDLRAAQKARDEAAAELSGIVKDQRYWQNVERQHAEFAEHKAVYGGNEHGDAADHVRFGKRATAKLRELADQHEAATAKLSECDKRISTLEAAALKA
jgi:hypothetical protein